MPLIAMNREIGSMGKDVAKGLASALGLKVEHHEMIDHLANRARMRKSHVVSFLEGSQGLLERLTTDQVKMRILTADEIVSLAENNDRIILRGWGATSLFKGIPNAVRVCVSSPRKKRVQRIMERLELEDETQAGHIVDQNDQAAQAVMRRHFHIEVRDINEYDVGYNTDRVSVEQCVEEIVRLVKSPQFADTDAARAKLRDLAVVHHVRAALRTHASTAHCMVRVTAEGGRLILEGVVENPDESRACTDIASRLKGVTDLVNRMRVGNVPVRLRGE